VAARAIVKKPASLSNHPCGLEVIRQSFSFFFSFFLFSSHPSSPCPHPTVHHSAFPHSPSLAQNSTSSISLIFSSPSLSFQFVSFILLLLFFSFFVHLSFFSSPLSFLHLLPVLRFLIPFLLSFPSISSSLSITSFAAFFSFYLFVFNIPFSHLSYNGASRTYTK
jgi:hypothetical protein